MIRFLALLCGLFAAIIAAEVVARPQAADAGSAMPRPAIRPPPKPADTAHAARGPWLAAVLARPLFAPDRRPVAGAVATDPGLPRLAGIIATPEGTMAIFQPAGAGKPVLARNGAHVGGWEVAKIEGDSVHLQRAGERVVLTPRFAAAVATPTGLRTSPMRH